MKVLIYSYVIDLGEKCDGCYAGNVIGSYLHGIFDEEDFRRAVVGLLCEKKGISYEQKETVSFREYKEQQYDKLADILRNSLDMDRIYQIIEEGA